MGINFEKEDQEYKIREMTCNLGNSTNNLYYQRVNNIIVIRDDKLCGGTKSRFVCSIIKTYCNYDKFAYISPWYGGAQIALSWGTRKYNEKYNTNKQAIIFAPQTDYDYPYMRIAKQYGAIYHYYTDIEEVEIYFKNHPDVMELPSGLDLPIVHNKINKLGRFIKRKFGEFDEFYYACGSGTLVRAIQKSGLSKIYYAICVTDGIPDNLDNAIGCYHYLTFDEIVKNKHKPPFNSSIHYDAKAWEYVPKNSNKMIIFWNVM